MKSDDVASGPGCTSPSSRVKTSGAGLPGVQRLVKEAGPCSTWNSSKDRSPPLNVSDASNRGPDRAPLFLFELSRIPDTVQQRAHHEGYLQPLREAEEPLNYVAVRIGLASPDKIRGWSHGEVKKPETINYRTFKPDEMASSAQNLRAGEGLRVPLRQVQADEHRGITCEKCGVEVIQSKVRRERMGHIDLATPVAHIWFLKSLPSRIGNLLDISLKSLERVLYCESYMVTNPGESALEVGEILTEEDYREAVEIYGYGSFDVGMGGEVIRDVLAQMDIPGLSEASSPDEGDELRGLNDGRSPSGSRSSRPSTRVTTVPSG